jgi:hypothetical protein
MQATLTAGQVYYLQVSAFSNFTGNYTVTAIYSGGASSVQIHGSAGSGGSISPALAQTNPREPYTFTITPASGYYVSSISGCGRTPITGDSSNTAIHHYTTSAITETCTVSALLARLPGHPDKRNAIRELSSPGA